MSASLREISLIDHCTPSISYDAQVQAGCTAFDKQLYQIIDDTPVVIFIPLILSLLDEELVDILAWQFHVDFYDASRPLAFKRQLVQNSIQWHMRKGTVALVQEVLEMFWPGGASLAEWYQYDNPLPPNYPIESPDTLIGSFTPPKVNVATDTITMVAHGLVNGNQIRFEVTFAFGSMLPVPLLGGIWYRVINATADTFKVSTQLGGAPVDLLTAGVGSNQVYKKGGGAGSWHDRYRFRVLIDETIILPEDEAQVMALINAYKPVSRWCEGLFRTTNGACAIGWYGACLQFLYISSEEPDHRVRALDYDLSGPAIGATAVDSDLFSVQLPTLSATTATVTVTPNDGGAGGVFTPATIKLTTANPIAQFSYKPASAGNKSIATTNDGGLADPAALPFHASVLATTYLLSGPASGSSGVTSAPFTVALPTDTLVNNDVTVTPDDGGAGGVFTPATVKLTTAAPSATFTYTPA
jgi:Phage tail protein (Tail_P2_I)